MKQNILNRFQKRFISQHQNKICQNCQNYNLISLMSVYIKLCYYLGIIPFKVYFDCNSETWKIHTSKPQSIFCYVGVITSNIFSDISCVPLVYWNRFLAAPSLSAKTYFSRISHILHSFGCLQFFWIFTTKQDLILDLLNSKIYTNANVNRIANTNKNQNSYKRCQIYLSFNYVIKIVLQIIMFISIYQVGMGFESPVTIFKKLIFNGKYRICLTLNFEQMQNYTNFAQTIPLSNFTTNDIFIGVLETWIRLSTFMTHTCIEIWYMGPLPIALWLATKMFVDFVECQESTKNGQDFQNKTIEMYESLKDFSNKINWIWGFSMLTWIIETFFRLIFAMDLLFSSRNAYSLLVMFSALLFASVTIIASGDVYSKVRLEYNKASIPFMRT